MPRVAALAFTLVVAGLAVIVLFEVAQAAGFSPLGSARTVSPRASVAAVAVVASSPVASRPGSAPPAVGAAGSSGRPAASSAPAAAASGSVGPSATPVAAASAESTLKPPPTSGPFAMDLYRKGDFVHEMNKISCVPAAMQTMMNIISPGADTTVATQQKLYALARKLSPQTLKGPGAEPEGWAKGLNQLGFGPYVVAVQRTRTEAIKAAAQALRLTGRPVGLLAWRGAHSWVMSGFKATADPATTDDFKVTAVNIEDVWYPFVSSIWGASRPPDTLVAVGLLPEDLFPWHRPTGKYPDKDGKYVLVLPVAG